MDIKITFWKAKDADITRYYVKSSDGEDLGYIQESAETRGTSTYYDKHRHAKGDSVVIDASMNLAEGIEDKLLSAFCCKDIDGGNHLDMAPIRNAAKGQPKLVNGRLKFLKGETLSI